MPPVAVRAAVGAPLATPWGPVGEGVDGCAAPAVSESQSGVFGLAEPHLARHGAAGVAMVRPPMPGDGLTSANLWDLLAPSPWHAALHFLTVATRHSRAVAAATMTCGGAKRNSCLCHVA